MKTVHTGSERDFCVDVYQAAVAGAATGPVTRRAIESLKLDPDRRVWVVAIGKAAHAMTAAAAEVLEGPARYVAGGIVVTPDDVPSPCRSVRAVQGDHPVPGRNSTAAAASVGEIAGGRRASDAVLVLLSGGTSSLIAAPVRGLGESDLSRAYELLLGAGLDIGTMNAVRKRFSRWAGGRLAVALAPAATSCLAMSDVPSDDPADIGSGPCSPDPYTIDDVLAILDRVHLFECLPLAFQRHLLAIRNGAIPDTPRASHPAFARAVTRVIGTNRLALDAAAARARELGACAADVTAEPLTGDAAVRGREIAEELIALRARCS